MRISVARRLAYPFLALLLFFSSVLSYAQVVTFEGDKEGRQMYGKKFYGVYARMNLGDKGFITVIGSPLNKESYIIYYFDAEGKLIWKKPTAEREGGISSKNESFLVTPDNSYVYYIQTNEDRIYDKKTYVQQVALDGTEKKFEIEGKEQFGKNLQTIICDKDYLYFAATENGDEYHKKKKVEDHLILTRFDHKTMTPKSFPVKTPAITEGDETSFWSYIGSKGDIKFFASKSSDKELNKNDFTVIGVNASGEIKSTAKFSNTFSAGKFLRPSFTVKRKLGNEDEVVRVDYQMKHHAGTGTGGSGGYDQLQAKLTTAGHLVYDANSDAFLVYGFYGPKPFKTLAATCEGIYVFKYDLNGQNVFKTEQPVGSKLEDTKYFRGHVDPIYRELSLIIFPDKRILLTVDLLDETKVPFLFSAEGKFVKSNFFDNIKHRNYHDLKILSVADNLKSANYVETTLKEEEGDFYIINNSKGEVLTFFPESKSKPVKNIFFKK
jgi:hypothetical protein